MEFLQIFLRKSVVLTGEGLFAVFGVVCVGEWLGGQKICLGSHRYLGFYYYHLKKSSFSLTAYEAVSGQVSLIEQRV